MTSYPAYLTTDDIANDIGIRRETAAEWVRKGKLEAAFSVYTYAITGSSYIKFLFSRPDYKEKSNYYKSYQAYIRRKKYVQQVKKEGRDDGKGDRS